MTESEPLPTDWPTEPLPDGPVLWSRVALQRVLREQVEARSPWDLPNLDAGNTVTLAVWAP
jgi:hypothetical protein